MINEDIRLANQAICDNIEKRDILGSGLLSQNILGQLRNLVEFAAILIYGKHIGRELENNETNNKKAIEYIKTRGDIRFLSKFHHFLQISRSHYITDYDNAERLMIKYLEYLLKLREYCQNEFGIKILQNLEDFPISNDETYTEYYQQITDAIEYLNQQKLISERSDRFYVQKTKPFYFKRKIYYELTLSTASDHASKFDRIIAFTDNEILPNYSILAYLTEMKVNVYGVSCSIMIITKWQVSIRVCEINNYLRILDPNAKIGYDNTEHRNLNRFLTETKMTLVDLLDLNKEAYDICKSKIHDDKVIVTRIFDGLDKCRYLSDKKLPGANILRYLLLRLNNKIVKWQYDGRICTKLSGLYLTFKCISFDEMPFVTSPASHNPRLYDIFDSIDVSGREHELLARIVKNNTENKSKLYTSLEEVNHFENIDELITKYNSNIYGPQLFERKLVRYNNHLYINGYEDDTINILRELNNLTEEGIKGYRNTVMSWLNSTRISIDDPSKKNALLGMFEKSRVALVYGSAGTGKTRLAEYISSIFNDYDKLFLANTHPAVNNLRRRTNNNRSIYKTISKHIYDDKDRICDILMIDECSTVCNSDMRKVLDLTTFRILVLIGDIYQIESITFGNWFSIAKKTVDKRVIYEFYNQYRTKNDSLQKLWKNVRELSDKILELLSRGNYSKTLDDSIFEPLSSDEIILCLNYNGLYGINNVNSILQSKNPNESFIWGLNTYKIGDPVLFNESKRFEPVIYNNLKGTIDNIKIRNNRIIFDIEVETAINELQIEGIDLELISTDNMKSVIRFYVNEFKNSDLDEDESSKDTIVPFQVSYSVSIHKAQGVEYESVKVVITKETEELISHNIFYTAITRAKKNLRIYWSPQTQDYILNHLDLIDDNKDFFLIKDKI